MGGAERMNRDARNSPSDFFRLRPELAGSAAKPRPFGTNLGQAQGRLSTVA